MIIKDSYVVTLEDATTINGKAYQDWRREKYIGGIGVLIIIAGDKSQHMLWHPVENGEIMFTKGLISSDSDIKREDNRIIVETKNSYYQFSMITKMIKGMQLN